MAAYLSVVGGLEHVINRFHRVIEPGFVEAADSLPFTEYHLAEDFDAVIFIHFLERVVLELI